MRRGTKRAAQAWAKLIQEGIETLISNQRAQGVDPSDLFPIPLPLLGTLPRGTAYRYCQEVNLAKKLADQAEYQKVTESELLANERAKKGLDSHIYTPRITVWVLRTQDEGGIPPDTPSKTDPMTFLVMRPEGRKRSKGRLFDIALSFVMQMEAAHGPLQVEKRPDVVDLFLQGEKRTSPNAAETPLALPKAEKPDAQEDLLASFYGTGPSPACPAIPPEAGLPEASSPSLPLSPRSKS